MPIKVVLTALSIVFLCYVLYHILKDIGLDFKAVFKDVPTEQIGCLTVRRKDRIACAIVWVVMGCWLVAKML